MTIMENILGGGTMSDKDIASDMLKDSKFGVSMLSMAAAEATNPQLRQLINGQLTASVNEHHRLSDIAIKKGWYKPYPSPQEQLSNDYKESQGLV